MREVCDEQRKVDSVFAWPQPSTIDVYGIRQRLEGIEGDTYGQDDVQGGAVAPVCSEGGDQATERFNEEIEILKNS